MGEILSVYRDKYMIRAKNENTKNKMVTSWQAFIQQCIAKRKEYKFMRNMCKGVKAHE